MISPDWLLTAAHVVSNYNKNKQVKLIFGLYDKINDSENKLETRIIKNTIIWGGEPSDPSKIDYEDDIALVQLDKPVNDIPPISLYSKLEKPIADTIATVIGWGISGIDNQGQNIMPTHLQEANIPILDDNVSKDSRWSFPYWNSQTEILAGNINTNKRINAANGDSGGPLIIKINNQNTIVGIVSHGPIDNNSDTFINPEPGIYTFIGAFYDWIEKNINANY